MRILCVGATYPGSTGSFLAAAFEELGHEVFALNSDSKELIANRITLTEKILFKLRKLLSHSAPA